MAKIYTKVGDKGMTALVGGQKVPKDHIRIHAYGTVDELNAFLGFARAELSTILKELGTAYAADVAKIDSFSKIDRSLERLQHWMFDFGSLLASDKSDHEKFKLMPLTQKHINWLETQIDEVTQSLPALREFILPGGSELASRLHLARTVCRRAERCIVELGDELPEFSIPFINRVSDYLFMLTRLVNQRLDIADVVWKKQEELS